VVVAGDVIGQDERSTLTFYAQKANCASQIPKNMSAVGR